MTWFKVDDKVHDHKKFRDPDLAAVGLWMLAAAWSADNRTDGFVPSSVLRRWSTAKKLTDYLVGRSLWEAAEVDGERGFRFHDWSDWQPEKKDTDTELGQLRWARKNALSKNRRVREAVAARDGGLCRYCGIDVNWTDRRGPKGATWDHVDPRILDEPKFTRANDIENIVVACRRCNGRKRDRTPEEAGMPRLPAGTTAEQLADARSRVGVSSGVDSRVLAALETGRSQVGAGSGVGSGRAPAPAVALDGPFPDLDRDRASNGARS